MIRREIYRVAEHYFALTMPRESALWGCMQQFDPFFVKNSAEGIELIFEATIEAEAETGAGAKISHPAPIEELVAWNDNNHKGVVDIAVDRTASGRLLRMIQPTSSEPNATMHISDDGSQVEASLAGSIEMQLQALNNVLIIGFLVAGAYRKTVLLHSSTVICDGRSYLFLGRSGTGKSTHSLQWLAAFAQNTTLLNDDHPIVRIVANGEVRTYGSPWSGKCQCYKNESAPLAGIVRIEQAPINEAIVLRPALAYASIITSSSSMQWLPEANNLKCETLNEIVTKVPSLRMRCLPNRDAAVVCRSTLDSLQKS